MKGLYGHHPGTVAVARWFDYAHLPEGKPRDVSAECEALAGALIDVLPDGPELTTGLRKLLEAKDCFVRAAIAASQDEGRPVTPCPRCEDPATAIYPCSPPPLDHLVCAEHRGRRAPGRPR